MAWHGLQGTECNSINYIDATSSRGWAAQRSHGRSLFGRSSRQCRIEFLGGG